jgi:hypothetical protein
MSISVMSNVWKYSQACGNDLLLLLAMADHADDEGVCWPSIGTLADKTRVSESTVKRSVKELVKLGELKIEENGGTFFAKDTTKRLANRYRVLKGKRTPKSEMTGGQNEPRGGGGQNEPGDHSYEPGAGVTAMNPGRGSQLWTPNHQKEPSKETSTTTESAAVTDTPSAPEGSSSFLFDGSSFEEPAGHRTSEEAAFKKEKASQHQPATCAVSADEEDNHTQELSELLEQFRPNRKQEADLKVYVTRFGLEHATDPGRLR